MDTPNYKQSTVSGDKWTRCVRVSIHNPLGAAPVVTFDEEDALVLTDRTIMQPSASLSAIFNPDDPADMAIYEALNAKYVALREARAAAQKETSRG